MDSVKVAIRIRPLIAREQGSEILWTADTHQIKLKEGKNKPYVFDRVFDYDETTSDVYEEIVEPIVQSAMGGFNGTVFAYGQTSSGKTYTMMGEKHNPGIIPLSVKETFDNIQKTPEREFLLRVSYMEIYNEVVRDLLVSSSEGPGLQIREDEFRNVVVQGLKEEMVRSPEEVLKLMEIGDKKRHTGCTNMNERSSRSHTIFRMIIESRERADANTTRDSIDTDTAIKVSQLNLVDLAGSERASQTGAEGQRFKEGCHINKSLSTLGLVINQICKVAESGQSAAFISYRDSKLTRILQPSLGGNALTAIICAVTPVSCDDTDSTLRFASNAKKIKNKPHVNEVLSDEALLYRQKREINQLKKKIHQLELNTDKKQTAELENLLEEKDQLQKEQEEKIQMLKKIILVSTQPADSVKRQRAIRRETWCPGKLSAAPGPLTPQPWRREARMDASAVNQSAFFQKLDQTLMASEFEPIVAKRARFMDNPVTSTLNLTMTPGSKQRAAEASENFVSLEEEVLQMRKRQEDLEEELKETKATKNKVIQEKESLNLKLKKMQGQITVQRETLDEVLEEKNQLEKDQEKLESSIKDQNQRISDFMRREKQWENTNPDTRALRNENMDLCDQLREVCGQNRKLQEKNDEDRDSLDFLQSTLEEVSKEAKEKETSLDNYKHQVSVLQSQLEATFANNTHSPTALQDVHKLEEDLITSKQDLERKNMELEEKMEEILKLQSQLEDAKTKTVTESGTQEDVDELLKTLEEQMQENHNLRIKLEEVTKEKASSRTEDDTTEVENLKKDLENLQENLAQRDEEITDLKKLLNDDKPFGGDGTINESVKVGEQTFGDYLTACEALIEERNTMRKERKELEDELEKLRSETRSEEHNESVRFGEKSMNEALMAYEGVLEEKNSANLECEKLRQELDRLQTERDQIKEDLAAMKEHDDFVQAEKDMLFEQEKESTLEIEKLCAEIQKYKNEIENLRILGQGSAGGVDDSEVQNLREEICNLIKSSEDAQEMLQETNKNLAVSHTTVENQKTQIDELEKELSRVKSDMESFDSMAELTKEQHERRVQDLTQQLQSAYDQMDDSKNGSMSVGAAQAEEYKILLDQKETEIENLNGKLASSSSRIEELKTMLEDYQKKLEESSQPGIQDEVPLEEQDAQISDADRFLTENNLSLDDLKNKLDAVTSLLEEKERILMDVQKASQRILELEETLKISKEEVESIEKIKERILELEHGISDRDAKLEELEKSAQESLSSGKLQEELDALRSQLQEKESDHSSLLEKMSEVENLNSEKDESIKQLDLVLAESRRKEEELEKQLNDSLVIPQNEDERKLREMLASTRKELLEMRDKFTKLQSVTEHAQGALLAETNRDLDQQRLIQMAEVQRREYALEIASERDSTNKQINQLLAKVNELQTSLCKANVDKDVAARQSEKMTQECEFLRQQVKELENIHHNEVSVIPRGQAMDPDKMAVKIKQLSLNLELTKQTSEKLTVTNKKLHDENKRLESEMIRVISLKGEVTRLEAILEQERKTREENLVRQNIREKESAEMRVKIMELQKNLKEMEINLEKQNSEASEIIKSASDKEKILQEEVRFLKEKLSSLENLIQDLKRNEEESKSRTQEFHEKIESLSSELEAVNSAKLEDGRKIESLQDRLDHAVTILDQEKEKSSYSQKQHQDLISDFDKIRDDLDNKEMMLKEAVQKNEVLQQNLDQLKEKLELAKQEVESVRSEILDGEKSKKEELEKNLDELKKKLEENESERESLQKKIDQMIEENQMKDSVRDDTLKQLQEEHNILIQENDSERESLQKKIDQMIEENRMRDSVRDDTFKQLQEEQNTLIQERDSLRISSSELDAQLEGYKDSSAQLQEDLAQMKDERDSLQSTVAELEDELENLKRRLEENLKDEESPEKLEEEMNYKMLQEQHNILTQEKDSIQDRVQELEVALALKEEEAANIQSKDEDSSSKVQELMNKIGDLEAELEEVILAKEEVSRMLDEGENHQKAITEIKENLIKKEEEIRLLKESSIEDSPDVASLQEKMDALEHLLSEKEEELTKSRTQIQDLEDKCASHQDIAKEESLKDDDGIGFAASLDQEVIENLQDQVAELKLQLEEKDDQIEDLKTKIESLSSGSRSINSIDEDAARMMQEEVENLKAQLQEMTTVIQSKDVEIQHLAQSSNREEDSLKPILDEKMQEISGLWEENSQLNERISKLQNLSSDQEEQDNHQQRIAELSVLLQEKDVQILELSRSKEDADSRICSLADKEKEIEILTKKRDADKFKISELESLLLSEKEAMAEMKQQLLDLGKSLEKEDSRIIELKRTKGDAEKQLQAIREENEILSNKMDLKDVELQKLKDENGMQEELKASVEEKCSELQESVSSLEETIANLRKDLEDAGEEKNKLLGEDSVLKKEKEELELKKKNLQSRLEELESEAASLEKDEGSRSKRIAELEADLHLYKEKASSLDEQLNSVYEMIQEKAALMEESASSRESLEKDVQKLQQENSALKSRLEEWDEIGHAASIELKENAKKTEERVRELVADVLDLRNSKDSLTSQVEKFKEENMALLNEMQEAVNRIQDLEQELSDVKYEKDSLKEDVEKKQNKAENHIQNLQDELEKLKNLKESLESQLSKLKIEQERNTGEKVENLKDELDKMKGVEDSLRSQLDAIKSDKQEKMQDAEECIQNLNEEVSKVTEMKDSLKQDLDVAQNEKLIMEKRIEELDLISKDHKRLLEELATTKSLLESITAEKDSAIKEVENFKVKIENLTKSHEKEVSKIKSAQNADFSELDKLREKLSADKKEAEKNVSEIQGLLYKKELEVQSLHTEVSRWERRYEEHKSDFDNAVLTAKDEIASINEKNSLKVYELEEELIKYKKVEKDLEQKIQTLSSDQEDKFNNELEREKAESKKLTEKITALEEEFSKKLSDSMEKAKLDKSRLLQRIDSLEDGLFETDKEMEEEKKKYEDLEKKFQELQKQHERTGATRTRASDKTVQELEALKEAYRKAEGKYKEEKQKNQQFATQLKSERRRCAELVAREMAAKNQSKFPGVDTSETAKELFMERDKSKTLAEKLAGCEADFTKRMKDTQDRMLETKKKMAARINELEDNCIEADTELDEEKKKTKDLEDQLRIAEKRLKEKASSKSASQEEDLRKQLENKENQVSRLEIKLTANIEPLQREITQLKEELKMSEERVSNLKQQLKLIPQTEEGLKTRSAAATSGRATRSSAKSFRGAAGGLVQDTKVYVLELEISDNERRIKFLEKELAKYKDIETKRRTENMELLEENKKYRGIIKKVREKKHGSSSDVLSEKSSVLNQASRADELPTAQSSQEDKCKHQ